MSIDKKTLKGTFDGNRRLVSQPYVECGDLLQTANVDQMRRDQWRAYDECFQSVLFGRDIRRAIDIEPHSGDSYFDLTPLLVDKDVGVLERKTQRATRTERQAA